MSVVRALVLGARGAELAVPGLDPIRLGPPGRRSVEARAHARARPLTAEDRATGPDRGGRRRVDLGRVLDGAMLDWNEIRALRPRAGRSAPTP
jgi:hypothetical protein